MSQISESTQRDNERMKIEITKVEKENEKYEYNRNSDEYKGTEKHRAEVNAK